LIAQLARGLDEVADAAAVKLRVVGRGARVDLIVAIAQHVKDQDRELAGRREDRHGAALVPGDAAVVGPERGLGMRQGEGDCWILSTGCFGV
jgi:hypothetical protein